MYLSEVPLKTWSLTFYHGKGNLSLSVAACLCLMWAAAVQISIYLPNVPQTWVCGSEVITDISDL